MYDAILGIIIPVQTLGSVKNYKLP